MYLQKTEVKNNRNFSIVKIEDSIPKIFINKLGQFNTIPFIDIFLINITTS